MEKESLEKIGDNHTQDVSFSGCEVMGRLKLDENRVQGIFEKLHCQERVPTVS